MMDEISKEEKEAFMKKLINYLGGLECVSSR
jgi:hypothetical protein